jgi:hypothetical protein
MHSSGTALLPPEEPPSWSECSRAVRGLALSVASGPLQSSVWTLCVASHTQWRYALSSETLRPMKRTIFGGG